MAHSRFFGDCFRIEFTPNLDQYQPRGRPSGDLSVPPTDAKEAPRKGLVLNRNKTTGASEILFL